MKKLLVIALAILSMGFALSAFAGQGFYLTVTDTNGSPYYITGLACNCWYINNLPAVGFENGRYTATQSFYTEANGDVSKDYGDCLYVGLVSLGSNENSSINPYYAFIFCAETGDSHWGGGSLYSFASDSANNVQNEALLQELNQSNCSAHWDDGYDHFYYGWYLNGGNGPLTITGTLSPY